MKKMLVLVSLVLFVATAAEAATLSYSTGTYLSSSYNLTSTKITATEGTDPIWEMRVWRPNTGDNTTHSWCAPGQIASFQDLQYGGTPFEYGTEKDDWFGPGLMAFGGMLGWGNNANAHFSFDTTHTDYYEFTWTTSGLIHLGGATDPNNTVDSTLTVRINAPTVTGNMFTTDISASLTLTNNNAGTLNLWYSAGTAGNMNMSVSNGSDATYNGAFVNPKDSTTKPNVHDTSPTDDHPIYAVSDWYGSTATTIDGTIVEAVVESSPGATAQNMRPGLTFRVEAEDMATYYNQYGSMYGSTTQDTNDWYVKGAISQPGPFGDGAELAPGASVTMDYTGFIGIIPEPATMALLGLGMLDLVLRRRVR